MRKPIIAGNWKMNNTAKATEDLLKELLPLVKDAKAEVAVCVPFTDIWTAKQLVKGTNVLLGAQNISWADKGAFTGEISGEMLVELGVDCVIIGHSERRQMFGETDESVNKRTITALKYNLMPIVCVGELESEKIAGKTEEVCARQVKGAFANISATDMSKIVIAYEPVWAIGTGKTATAEDANNTIKFIRSVVASMYGAPVAETVRIQYGGSMNPSNVSSLMSMSDIDGGLIGGASLKAGEFSKVVNF